jgi:hypothetical protein
MTQNRSHELVELVDSVRDAIESCDTISGISMSGAHVATKLDEARTIATHLGWRLRQTLARHGISAERRG